MSGSPQSLPLPESATREILKRREDPSGLLAWLTTGDPLHLENRGALLMRKLAFLVDSERLFEKSVVAVTLKARIAPPEEVVIEEWLDHCLVIAKDRLLIEDARFVAGKKEIDPADKRLESYSFLLGMPPRRIMPALVAFNCLDAPPREAFFRLLIEDISVQACLEAGMGPPDLLRERCLHALRTVLLEPLEEEGLL